MTNSHNLKTWPEFFHAVREGVKTFELRENDRGFEVGDTLVLQEFIPESGTYTGEEEVVRVTYLLEPSTNFRFIAIGYVLMGIKNEYDGHRCGVCAKPMEEGTGVHDTELGWCCTDHYLAEAFMTDDTPAPPCG